MTTCGPIITFFPIFSIVKDNERRYKIIQRSRIFISTFTEKAAKELAEDYPDRKIIVIDSLRYSTGFGLLCVRAAMERETGKNIDEVAKWVEENKCKCHQMGFLDDLSFVAMKGRISKAKAFMGQMIGVKPLAEFSYEGLPCILAKTKGDQAFFDACIKYIEKTIINPEEQIIFIAQTARMKQALELKQKIEERFKPKEVIINDVMPQNGINIGPGLCAAYYFGKEISIFGKKAITLQPKWSMVPRGNHVI